MRAQEIYPKYKLWTAPVRIQQPGYVGYIDVTVTAANMQDARRLMKAQYGVEVMGYNMTPTDEYQPQRGDRVVDQNADWTRYTFPVKPGTSSMRSGRRGTGIYTSQASMIAKWTSQ